MYVCTSVIKKLELAIYTKLTALLINCYVFIILIICYKLEEFKKSLFTVNNQYKKYITEFSNY